MEGGTVTDLTNASPYTAGTGVGIKAVAAAGYEFVSWSAPAGTFAYANAAQTTFTMPAQNVVVTANFFQGQLIRDWHDLHAIRDNPGDNYLLMNDLNSSTAGYTERASPTANGGKGWQPIGSLNASMEPVDPFTGTFDGQGYKIIGLFIDRPDENGVGLFGAVDVGGVIENVEMVDADVTGSVYVGILVGCKYGGSVSSSYSSGSVTGNYSVGGLVGDNVGTVSNSHASGDVTGSRYNAGGLVGGNGGTVSNSHADGDVTGNHSVGGLVGFNYGDVSNSYATGDVTGTEQHAGGLVGYNRGAVDSSYADGDVTGTDYVGGLVGYNWIGSGMGTVSNSYSTASVAGDDYVGGLVGFNDDGTVDSSYSTGSVTGNTHIGGLVGHNDGGSVTASFWDTQTSGQGSSAGGTGKTTAEMKDIDTFTGAGWDIISVANINTRNTGYVWNIVDDATYPFLSWQPV
jgi:hypothetical protein